MESKKWFSCPIIVVGAHIDEDEGDEGDEEDEDDFDCELVSLLVSNDTLTSINNKAQQMYLHRTAALDAIS